MTYLQHTLIRVLIILLGGMALVACGHDEPVQPPVRIFKLRLQLTTDIEMTRAEGENWGDDYNSIFGSPLENRISTVEIYILAAGSEVATRVKAEKDPFSSGYTYILELPADTPGVTYDEARQEVTFDGRIMAVANVDDLDSPVNAPSNWPTAKIPYSLDFTGSLQDWSIPMWGIESYTGVTLRSDEIAELDREIYMLRSVSKIIINLDTETDVRSDYKLGEITMSPGSPRLYAEGYTLPKDALTQTSTRTLGREGCFDPKTGEDFKKFENPDFISKTDFEKYTYVSESLTVAEHPFEFEVTLVSLHEDRPDIKGTLYFSNYIDFEQDATITDVVRNHIYEFTIRLSDFKLKPVVKEWRPGGKVHIEW